MEIYLGLRALIFISLLQGTFAKIIFPLSDNNVTDNPLQNVRSMEITAESKESSSGREADSRNPDTPDPDRILKSNDVWEWEDHERNRNRESDRVLKYDIWESESDRERNRNRDSDRVLKYDIFDWEDRERNRDRDRNQDNRDRDPYHDFDKDEKTISFQILDDDPYQHGRPAWPHDEYILNYHNLSPFNRNTTSDNESDRPNNGNFDDPPPGSDDDMQKYYEWKRLQARPSPSAFIGPGFYDVGSGSNNKYYNYEAETPERYRYQPTYSRITTDGSGKVTPTSQSNAETVPGTPSESTTNTRHFSPYVPSDHYKRKRLRLQIHPGLIAAPIAGLAAFGAASALTSKPLLVELGYVRNKPIGGWGWAGSFGTGYRPYPTFYPPPNPPIHHRPFLPPHGTAALAPGHLGPLGHGHAHAGAGGVGGTVYPILQPHRSEGERSSSWWNPFSALTPRLIID